jgi:hypothetical protein
MWLIFMVFDGAKIGFCGTNDSAHKTHQTHCIGTISAVKFGNPIQIFQLLSIKNNVFRPAKGFDFVDRETQELIQRHKCIQHQQRQDDAINDGPCDQVDGPGSFDQGPQTQLVITDLGAHVECPLIAISAHTVGTAAVIDALS